jgi:DNA-binding NarL/FixJ family response regulator
VHARSVLIVEDDALLRDLLANAVEARGFVVDTAASAADAKRAFRRADPDAAIIDVELGPGPNGFDLAHIFRVRAPHLAIVFLTNVPDPRFVASESADLPSGIAYLRKSMLTDADSLITALDATLRGSSQGAIRQDLDADRPLADLTAKQIAVLRLIAEGRTNSQIAEIRGVTAKAIEDTVTRLGIALGIDSSIEGNVRVAVARKFLEAKGISGARNDREPPFIPPES